MCIRDSPCGGQDDFAAGLGVDLDAAGTFQEIHRQKGVGHGLAHSQQPVVAQDEVCLLYTSTPQTGFPNVTGSTVGNFNDSSNGPDPAIFTMEFTNLQDDVAFAMVSNNTSWTFEALLNGIVQESFTTNVGSGSDNFYGFTSLTLDAIRITGNGPDSMLIDNVQLGDAGGQVPEPTSLALVVLALLGAGATARRRQT